MSKVNGSDLMFDEEVINNTPVRTAIDLLPRLIRIAFYSMRITLDSYQQQYYHHFREQHPDKSKKEFIQKIASDRKFLKEDKLSFPMMSNILTAMGEDIVEVSIKTRNRLTGEFKEFSTSDTVASIKERLAKEDEIGVDGI